MSKVMDIYIANVSFDDRNQSKRRPALVLSINNKYVIVFKITTKYTKKSSKIKKLYYPIQEWSKSGLNHPSYVDTHMTYSITKREVFKRPPIGKLSDNDITNLYEFIKNEQ